MFESARRRLRFGATELRMPKNLRILCLISLVMAACSTRDAETNPSFGGVASPVQQGRTQPSSAPSSAIRLIDFANFTYPGTPVYKADLESFTLQKGEFKGGDQRDSVRLAYLDYGDAT